MQKDAIERLGLNRLLLEPEMLEAVEPDVHLVGTLLSLSRVLPETGPGVSPRGGRRGDRVTWSGGWRSGPVRRSPAR